MGTLRNEKRKEQFFPVRKNHSTVNNLFVLHTKQSFRFPSLPYTLSTMKVALLLAVAAVVLVVLLQSTPATAVCPFSGDCCICWSNTTSHCSEGHGCLVDVGTCSPDACAAPRICLCTESSRTDNDTYKCGIFGGGHVSC